MGKIIKKIESGNNTLVVGINDFKKKLIDYFKEPNVHITLSQLMKYFELGLDDLDALQLCMDELVKEKYLTKIKFGLTYYGYDPGEKLNFVGTGDEL
jgi:hypothetical protein